VNLCRAVASTQSEKLLQELRGWRAAQLHLGYQKEEDRMRTAWQNRLVWALGVVVLVASVLMLWQKTQAQLEMPPAPGEVVAMQPPGQPVPPPPGPGQPFPGIGERLALGQVAIAANSDYVYVVRGNTLYQFSARTLELVKSTDLPRPQIRPRAAGAETQPLPQLRQRRRLQGQGQPPAQP